MNYSTAVMLINPNIRAISTLYQPDVTHNDGSILKKAVRTIFKTLDQSIKKGDFVVVPTNTRHGATVVLVEDVDVEVDFESSTEIHWVIDRVSKEGHTKVLSEEGKWIEALKASEKRRKREEIKRNMLAMYDDDGIQQLPIASLGAPTLVE